jgi:hypothetical protein
MRRQKSGRWNFGIGRMETTDVGYRHLRQYIREHLPVGT